MRSIRGVPVAGGIKLDSLLVALALSCVALPAPAAPKLSFALDYDAPPSCPDAAEFAASITARAPGSERVADPSLAGFVFEAHISELAGVARGYLLVRPASGAVSRRDVPDASCAEIVASMAVIAALVLEDVTGEDQAPTSNAPPAAPTAPTPSAPVPTAPPPTAVPPPPAQRPPPPPRPPAPRAPPAAPVPLPPAPPRREAAQPAGWHWRPGLAVGAVVESGAGPTLAPGLAVGLDVSAETPEVLAPSARLTGLYVTSQRDTPDGLGKFQWLSARVAICPLRWRLGVSALRPCVELDLGQLQGRGEDTLNGQTQSLFWLAIGPAAHLEVELGRFFAIEGQLGARVLGDADTFKFLPDTEVYEMPRISYGGLLGLVARLP